jgi:hypothetical protein
MAVGATTAEIRVHALRPALIHTELVEGSVTNAPREP